MAIIKKMSGYDEDLDERRPDRASAPAILPKSILMGKSVEVGDKVILKVDRITEDGLAVSYATETKTEGQPAESPEPEEPGMKPESPGGYD